MPRKCLLSPGTKLEYLIELLCQQANLVLSRNFLLYYCSLDIFSLINSHVYFPRRGIYKLEKSSFAKTFRENI